MTAIALILTCCHPGNGLVGYRFCARQTGPKEAGRQAVQCVPGSTVDISPLLTRMGYKRRQRTGGSLGGSNGEAVIITTLFCLVVFE
jgi:hypothetical protein